MIRGIFGIESYQSAQRMSIEMDAGMPLSTLGPELTALGKRIEMLRIERGISKQHLARFAGTSRQQLWRVMTGKSDLTGSLRERLAEALQVEAGSLSSSPPLSWPEHVAHAFGLPVDAAGATHHVVADAFELYLANADAIAATLARMPSGDLGTRLKRAHLDALEDAALAERLPVSEHVFELRRKVVNGEL